MTHAKTINTFVQESDLPSQLEGANLLREDVEMYRSIASARLYLSQVTRYFLCYAVYELAEGMSAPTITHLIAAKRGPRYVWGKPSLKLVYGGKAKLTAFCDASIRFKRQLLAQIHNRKDRHVRECTNR